MSTHNIYFYGELTKIILQLSSNTLLICSIARVYQSDLLTPATEKSVFTHSFLTSMVLCVRADDKFSTEQPNNSLTSDTSESKYYT